MSTSVICFHCTLAACAHRLPMPLCLYTILFTKRGGLTFVNDSGSIHRTYVRPFFSLAVTPWSPITHANIVRRLLFGYNGGIHLLYIYTVALPVAPPVAPPAAPPVAPPVCCESPRLSPRLSPRRFVFPVFSLAVTLLSPLSADVCTAVFNHCLATIIGYKL